jgi:ribosomal protein S18 acetylase RimI-like enzyme
MKNSDPKVTKHSGYSDLEKIAKCYRKAFPDSIKSRTGIKYLVKNLEWFIYNKSTFLFHIEDERGNVLGFCGGIVKDDGQRMGSTSGMIQYSFKEGIEAIIYKPWLLFDREMISNYRLILKNIRLKFLWFLFPQRQSSSNKEVQKEIGLVVIGVQSDARGTGVGRLLMKQFEEISREHKINRLQLSVKCTNHSAIRFYKNLDWSVDEVREISQSMTKFI